MRSLLTISLLLASLWSVGQDTIQSADTTKVTNTRQDGLYSNRPFITGEKNTAVGGYLEANTNYFIEDGVGEGFSMEMRRFNLFLFSRIGKHIRMLSELEFEHGTEEIALETAIMDFTFNPAFNVRAGILLPPIGAFNQNHDSPLWEIVDRPLVSTEIIPSTLSETGFGIFGKFYRSQWVMTYDLYVVNGLQGGVVLNDQGRTSLASGKSEEMFAEDNNGTPMYTGRLGLRHRKYGELGFSYYGGAYNTFQLDGEAVDDRYNLGIYAADFNLSLGKLSLNGEFAYNRIQVAEDLKELYAEKQWGGHVDFIYPLMKKKIFKFDNAVLNGVLRLERVDYNVGTFASTNTNIGDDIDAVVLGLSLRPSPSTVIKANYRYHWIADFLDNARAKAAGIQFGFATYF